MRKPKTGDGSFASTACPRPRFRQPLGPCSMTASPTLETAIRAGCEIGTRCDYPACGGSCPSRVTVTCALRSLATPTPEVIEAMARAIHEDRIGDTFPWAKREDHMKEPFRGDARAAHAALWAHIL